MVIGAINRDKGLKGAKLKSFQLYEAALDPSQVQALHAGTPVMQAKPRSSDKQAQLQAARQKLYDLQDRIPRIMTMRETAGEPVKTYILNRGEYNLPGEEVQPAMPEIIKRFYNCTTIKHSNR